MLWILSFAYTYLLMNKHVSCIIKPITCPSHFFTNLESTKFRFFFKWTMITAFFGLFWPQSKTFYLVAKQNMDDLLKISNCRIRIRENIWWAWHYKKYRRFISIWYLEKIMYLAPGFYESWIFTIFLGNHKIIVEQVSENSTL